MLAQTIFRSNTVKATALSLPMALYTYKNAANVKQNMKTVTSNVKHAFSVPLEKVI